MREGSNPFGDTMNDDEKRANAQAALDNGGLLVNESGENLKFHIAVDPRDPMKVFDKLNELEIELVKKAGSNIKRIEEISDFIDNVRRRTVAALKSVNIEVSLDNVIIKEDIK